MLTRNLAKSTWVLGVIVILCSSNVAFGDVATNETAVTTPATELSNNLKDNDVSKSLTNETANTSTLATKKNVLVGKRPAAPANACACTCTSSTAQARPAAAGWWACVKACLRDAGVSIVQVVLCGVACATGNIPVCAICIGIDVTILAACAIGCETFADTELPGNGHGPILVRKKPQINKKGAASRALAFTSQE